MSNVIHTVEYTCTGGSISPYHWLSSMMLDGRPTGTNLHRHIEALVFSFAPDGLNAHVGRHYPDIKIVSAHIVRHDRQDGSREIVATYHAS